MKLGEFTAIILQFSEKFIIESFLQNVILLVIGLKILSLKHKNEENESFFKKIEVLSKNKTL